MKKPKITEGEWHVNTTAFGDTPIVTTKENGWVADIPQSDGMELANAKAISAVPEMIDALIEAKNATHHSICGLEWAQSERSQDFNESDGEHLMWLRKVEKQIEQALEKAGVEL